MSVKIMARVWADSKQSEGTLLVALALADFADDEGYCWPKIDTIASKARLGPRMVQYAIKKLIEDGELEKVYDPTHRKSNTFHFIDANLDPEVGVQLLQGAVPCTQGVQPIAPPSIIEPSIEPSLGVKVSDPIFRSIKEFLFSLDGIPPPERRPQDHSRVTQHTKAIFASTPDVTIEEVKRRAENYRKKWPKASLTANALAKHYPSLGDVTTPSTSTSDSIPHY